MLTELKFVQGAVAKKDFLPALTHFAISNGTVRGYNGTIALCSPIPFDIECNPKAEPLVRAIGNCAEVIQLALTPAGRLSVKSGGFKAFVDCVAGDTPHVLPTGAPVQVNGERLLAGLRAVHAFMGEDASRPWCNGILVAGTSVFATNNVTLVEYWAGETLDVTLNLPRAAVREMLRIDEPPVSACADETSVTFFYEGNRWLRTQLLSTEWPDLGRVLNVEASAQPVPEGLFSAVHVVKPFADKLGRVFFRGGAVHTHAQDGEGASHTVEGMQHTAVFNADMLCLLEGVAHTIDFSTYPRPCMFYGDGLRGAIIGMRE